MSHPENCCRIEVPSYCKKKRRGRASLFSVRDIGLDLPYDNPTEVPIIRAPKITHWFNLFYDQDPSSTTLDYTSQSRSCPNNKSQINQKPDGILYETTSKFVFRDD